MSQNFMGAASWLGNKILLALVPALLMPFAATASSPAAPPIDAVDQVERQSLDRLPAFIDEMVASQIRTSEVAGAVVTIVHDGKIFTNKGYGFKNIEDNVPVDPDTTLFHPGSVSKLFTWVALAQQIEAGLTAIAL